MKCNIKGVAPELNWWLVPSAKRLNDHRNLPQFRCRGCCPPGYSAATPPRPRTSTGDHSTPARANGTVRPAPSCFPDEGDPQLQYFPATSHTMFVAVSGTGPVRPAVSYNAAPGSHSSLASFVGVWAPPPLLLAGPMELLCEQSALSPRPEPAINGGLMKALIYRSPLDATLGLCGGALCFLQLVYALGKQPCVGG